MKPGESNSVTINGRTFEITSEVTSTGVKVAGYQNGKQVTPVFSYDYPTGSDLEITTGLDPLEQLVECVMEDLKVLARP